MNTKYFTDNTVQQKRNNFFRQFYTPCGRENKTGVKYSVFFEINVCSGMPFKTSRREFSIDAAERL